MHILKIKAALKRRIGPNLIKLSARCFWVAFRKTAAEGILIIDFRIIDSMQHEVSWWRCGAWLRQNQNHETFRFEYVGGIFPINLRNRV